MLISLYTSRVVLDALGVEDYGIYNVVGSVVVLFSFLNSALLQATQRFLNFELGKKDLNSAHNIFCMSMNAYIILAVIFTVIAETIGLWFVNSALVIPDSRLYAANWVYQLSILSFIVSLIKVPYNATIIAYEKMDFYAYLSILEVILRLVIVYLIVVCSFDRLIYYAILCTIISILIAYIYKFYCNKHFQITRYRLYWNKSTFKQLFSFSSWSLFGSVANMLASQGLIFLVNMFHGVAVNAALGIANQISSKVIQFFTNFQMAFNPQIVKKYAANETESLYNLVFSASKFSYFIMLIVSFPLILKMDVLLGLWLVDVPKYTLEFSQLILIFMMIEALSGPLWMFVQATGQIKNYQILMGIIIFLNFPLSYLVLKMGMPVYSIWLIRILVDILTVLVRCIYMSKKYSFPVMSFLSKVIWPITLVTTLIIPLPLLIDILPFPRWYGVLLTFSISILVSIILIYFLGMSTYEKDLINKTVKVKLLRYGRGRKNM